MTDPDAAPGRTSPPRDDVPDAPFDTSPKVKASRLERRRNKIVADIERNRRGDYVVPTWVLTTLLVLVIAGFAFLILVVAR
jgi:hypothetical protein